MPALDPLGDRPDVDSAAPPADRHAAASLAPAAAIGAALAILRIARGWKQDDLARQSGVRPSAISDYERGRKFPELQTLERLLTAMGYPLGALDLTRRYLEQLLPGHFALAPPPLALPLAAPSPQGAAACLWEIEQAAAALAAAVGRIARLQLLLLLDRAASADPQAPADSVAPDGEPATPSQPA